MNTMHETISALLERQCDQQGQDRVFARFTNNTPLTFGELEEASRRTAAGLEERGISPGDRVLLTARTSPQLLAALFGLWRLGAIVMPTDVFMTSEALAGFAHKYGVDALLLDESLPRLDGLRKSHNPIGLHDLASARPMKQPASVQAATPALCIFTSGSTGTPKGILHTHASLLAGAANTGEGKGLSPEDRILCVLPLSHLNGLVTTLLCPLLTGCGVVYLQDSFTPRSWSRAVEDNQCTVFSATPTQYALLAAAPTLEGDVSSLRFCRSASAPLASRIHQNFEKRYRVPIIETMGTSETAGQIFSNPLPPGQRKISSVGLPIGFQVRLTDEDRVVKNRYKNGEIQVSGSALMQSYLDDAKSTSEAIKDGWFSTGDIAYIDEDGYYFIVGRKKDIIIFSGVNISLASLEGLLKNSPLIHDAALVSRTHEIFGEVFDAHILPADGVAPSVETAEQIFKILRQELPNPQCIGRILIQSEFPRSAVGKTLKEKLRPTSAILSWSPETDGDDVLAFMASVLEVDPKRLAPDMIFGDIPEWDSMGYIALLAAIEKRLDRQLTTDEMDKLMSVGGISSLIEGSDHDKKFGVYDYGLHL